MVSLKCILVTGATGKQGGGVIQSFVTANHAFAKFDIIAISRSLTSSGAQKLISMPNFTVVEGDLNDVSAVLSKVQSPIYGVFSVQAAGNSAVEEKQGKDLIDAAVKIGV